MTETLPRCAECGTELPDPLSPCACMPEPLPYKPSPAAIEWVASNMSHQLYNEDWITAGTRTFDAGFFYAMALVRGAMTETCEENCQSCWAINNILISE